MSALMTLSLLACLQEASTLKLTVATDATEPTIGDLVQVEVHVVNGGSAPVTLPALTFDERSVGFRVTAGASTYDYTRLTGHPLTAKRLDLDSVVLAAGKEMVGYFHVPALAPGAMKIKGILADGETPIESAGEITLNVKAPAEGARLAAVVDTEMGTFTIELETATAPRNVSHFVSLVKRRFYDGMIFHAIVRDKWMTTGCPFGKGTGGPDYAVRGEVPEENAPKHVKGTVSLSGFGIRDIKDFTGSQFFVCMRDLPAFDGNYTVIGQVKAAADHDVLYDISQKGGSDARTIRPTAEIRINSISIKAIP